MNEGMGDMTAAGPLAGEELERVMARYARVRLDPSQSQARRARQAVMEAAWRRRIAALPAAAGPVTLATTAAPARHGPFAAWAPRRIGLMIAAAIVAGLMVGSSVFAASRAGGPLYAPRLALEWLSLPADPDARVDAEVVQAEARLGEAVDAGDRHDDDAAAAALAAYSRTIDAVASARGSAAVRALEAIRTHRTILLRVAASAPASAADGLRDALADSDRVITALAAASPAGSGGKGNEGGGGNGGAGGGGGRPSEEPAATPKPAASQAPVTTPKTEGAHDAGATPKPHRTPDPRATPRPHRTPKPHEPRRTPDPGGPRHGRGTPSSVPSP